jgi:DNA repair exonuclease SbcCD nuclease subunit
VILRVAIVADSHFDEHSRFQECIDVHRWIAQDIANRGVDLVLHAGDVYERKSTPRERAAVAEWVQEVTKHAPMIIVRGNHCPVGDLPLLERLDTVHTVRVVEGAEAIEACGTVIGCMAWPTKSSVLAMGAESRAEGESHAGDALRNVLRGLGAEMASKPGRPRILLAHAMVRGSVTSTGQPLVGHDLEVGIEDLALSGADFYALGHIHKGQQWEVNGAPVVYPGSPRRTAFGELEAKGYILATFDGPKCIGWELIQTPCAPMVLVEDEWGACENGARGWLVGLHGMPESLDGAEVRFRYSVPADMREEARLAAAAIEDDLRVRGAVNVKVDPVVRPVNTARAPEVARATTLREKLAAYWSARGTTPDERRAESLLAKASELEDCCEV